MKFRRSVVPALLLLIGGCAAAPITQSSADLLPPTSKPPSADQVPSFGPGSLPAEGSLLRAQPPAQNGHPENAASRKAPRASLFEAANEELESLKRTSASAPASGTSTDSGAITGKKMPPSVTPAVSAAIHAQHTLLDANQCWVQSVVKPRPQRQNVEIVTRDALTKLDVTPPQLANDRKEVVVREGGTASYRVIPASYRPVTEQVLVKPEVKRSVVIPAVFEDVEETVEIEAARTEVRECKSTVARNGLTSGRMFCTDTIPAKTKTVLRKRLVTPESTQTIVEPAEYQTITRWVLDKPAATIAIEAPEQKHAIAVKTVEKDEEVITHQVPAEIKQLEATTYANSAYLVTVQGVCDGDITPQLIGDIQAKLAGAGYDAGASDGKLGKKTVKALMDYQEQHGLAYGAITYESLNHLGVSLPARR